MQNSDLIDISRITKAGDFRLVTARGKETIRKSMKEMGVLPMERLLIQELPEKERTLGDGKVEYMVIDGNHRIQVARELSPDHQHMNWVCDIVKVHHLCFKPLVL